MDGLQGRCGRVSLVQGQVHNVKAGLRSCWSVRLDEGDTALCTGATGKQHGLLLLLLLRLTLTLTLRLVAKSLHNGVDEGGDAPVDKEARVASHHAAHDPLLALLVADVGLPCWQRHTDGLHERIDQQVSVCLGDVKNGETHMCRVWRNRLAEL